MESTTLDPSEVAGALVDMFAESSWYEAKLHCPPRELYACLMAQAPGGVLLFHHFYEPWHRTGAVARLLVVDAQRDEVLALLDEWTAVVDFGLWERERNDRDLYGEDFHWAMQFFQGASMFASHGPRMTHKLVHCVLNAHGMHRKDELLFGLRLAWYSLTTESRLWLRSLKTGRKWWE